MLSTVGFSFIIALGIVTFLDFIAKKRVAFQKISKGAIVFFLSIEVIFFCYNYYCRRVITMSEMFFESERKIAQYMISHKRSYKIYTNSPRDVLFSYLFFNNGIDIRKAQEVVKKGAPYRIDGFEIYVCPSKKNYTKKSEIIMDTCLSQEGYDQIQLGKKPDDIIRYTNFSGRNSYFIFN
jgi:hypothetical protein